MRQKKTFLPDMLKALAGLTPEDRQELRQVAKTAGVPLEYFVLDPYNRHIRTLRRKAP